MKLHMMWHNRAVGVHELRVSEVTKRQVLHAVLTGKPEQTQNTFLTAYGVGTNIVAVLPYSRNAENESDKFGLFFAAMAGYNPETAIPLGKEYQMKVVQSNRSL
jgi:predicted Zn-dependent protease